MDNKTNFDIVFYIFLVFCYIAVCIIACKAITGEKYDQVRQDDLFKNYEREYIKAVDNGENFVKVSNNWFEHVGRYPKWRLAFLFSFMSSLLLTVLIFGYFYNHSVKNTFKAIDVLIVYLVILFLNFVFMYFILSFTYYHVVFNKSMMNLVL